MSKKSQPDFCCTKENPPEAVLEGGPKRNGKTPYASASLVVLTMAAATFVRVCVGRSSSILESADPAVCVRGHRNPNGGSSIGDAITKRVDGLGFMITG